MNSQLSDREIVESFHLLLKSSLVQAKAERLLDVDGLSSAEADLMVCGPALCMFFAALRSATSPPSVPLPRIDKSQPSILLSFTNCPPVFIPMLRSWSNLVPRIQELHPEQQHDLARVICGLPPLLHPSNPHLDRIAAELRATAIELSQRRSFQERYAFDLQAAIDAGEQSSDISGSKLTTSFHPPPSYDETLPGTSLRGISELEVIRETLYAALADVIALTPSICNMLERDPSKMYYTSISLAILRVVRFSISNTGTVEAVLGRRLTIDDCPEELRPLMAELVALAHESRSMMEEDDEQAISLVAHGKVPLEARLDKVVKMLERGVTNEETGAEDPTTCGNRRRIEGRTIQFVNRIGTLALNLSSLQTFRERQVDVFRVLSGSA